MSRVLCERGLGTGQGTQTHGDARTCVNVLATDTWDARLRVEWRRAVVAEVIRTCDMVRPHIVLVLADDLGHNGIGFRNPALRTPTLNRLGREGVLLEDFYTAPTCAPARASLMTSRWSFKSLSGNYAYFWVEEGLHEGYTLLPKALARRGYVSRMVGKVRLSSGTIDRSHQTRSHAVVSSPIPANLCPCFFRSGI